MSGSDFSTMYKAYLAEREGAWTVEAPEGFAVLRVLGDSLYLQDVWVKPAYRQLGIARQFLAEAERQAASMGISSVITSCSPGAANSDVSMKAIMAVGFKLMAAETDLIWFKKDI